MAKRKIFQAVFFSLFFLQVFAASSSIQAREAKHIILVIGDGMSLSNEVAASRYLYGKDSGLVFHFFPYKNFMTTWDLTVYERNRCLYVDGHVNPECGYDLSRGGSEPYPQGTAQVDRAHLMQAATDSASSATAMASGVKVYWGEISWLRGHGPLKTFGEVMREKKGAALGVVSTVPFSHVTPAAFTAHNQNRRNYYTGYKGYKDEGIADEIIRRTRPEVVISGGHPRWNNPQWESGKGYISRVLYRELKESSEYVLAERQPGVPALGILEEKVQRARIESKRLFGLFGDQKGKFSARQLTDDGSSVIKRVHEDDLILSEASLAALEILSSTPNGFFLLIEQGDIDWANHDNDAHAMIAAMADLNEAVQAVCDFIEQPNNDMTWENTLLIVTSDHATGDMRINKVLEKGKLPRLTFGLMGDGQEDEIQYLSKRHTNELVSLYARGCCLEAFRSHEGRWYPGTRLIDNTHIFEVMSEASGLGENY